MLKSGATVYLLCTGEGGRHRLIGTVVEEDSDNLIVAIDPDLAGRVSEAVVFEKEGQISVGFVKVPCSAVSQVLPAGWDVKSLGKPSALSVAGPAWQHMRKKVDIQSSDVEPVAQTAKTKSSAAAAASGSQRALEAELMQMGEQLWGKGGESEEESDSEEDARSLRQSGVKHLPPGVSGMGKSKSKEKSKEGNGDLMQRALLQAMSSGQSPSDLMPLMMMSMMMNQQKEQKKQRRKDSDLLGSSSSGESSDEETGRDGLKAVSSKHRLDRRIKRHPKAIVREFEKELVKDLGVVPGQAWSVRDYLKKQNWGKFKGIYRTAMQDAAVYEYLRAGDPDAACAQVVQNLKSKMQAVLQGGDWSTAWMLTGLPDPLSRKEWDGTQTEMAVISGYLNSLHKLRKKVKEAKEVVAEED